MVMRTENYDEVVADALDHCPIMMRDHFLITAAAGEVGELLNLSKKAWRMGRPLTKEEFLSEAVDAYNYLHYGARYFGVTSKELHVLAREKALDVKERPEYQQYGLSQPHCIVCGQTHEGMDWHTNGSCPFCREAKMPCIGKCNHVQ